MRGDDPLRCHHLRRPLLLPRADRRGGRRDRPAGRHRAHVLQQPGEAALEETARCADAWHGGADGRVTVSLGPHAPYTVDDGDLRTLAGHARRLGLRMHIHAAEHLEQTRSSLERRGITPIRVLHETGVLDTGALIAHGCLCRRRPGR
ncbi:amidohydrolase family protein [Streptomyces africanus]|uniref:amidohydrolase family protein n=1 Tax=Streptomyces africanus TaxID=231024 RepID=UPI0027D8AA16|nr:amidohydrolase family protein [Streptomyces africanus]